MQHSREFVEAAIALAEGENPVAEWATLLDAYERARGEYHRARAALAKAEEAKP